jgi:hypothetical protein
MTYERRGKSKGCPSARWNERKFQILRLLENYDPMLVSSRKVAVSCGISTGNAILLLNRYERLGLVESQKGILHENPRWMGRGWRLTEKGSLVLAMLEERYRCGYLELPPKLRAVS